MTRIYVQAALILALIPTYGVAAEITIPPQPAKVAPIPEVTVTEVFDAPACGTGSCGTGSCTSCGKSHTSCLARICDWLCYQPLCRPNKCCKPQPMPCCYIPNYTFFPCTPCAGPGPSYAGPACGCSH